MAVRRSATTRKERPEPKPDPADDSPRNCYLLCNVAGGYWRAYMDAQGEQEFTQGRAFQLLDHLKRTNPDGWAKLKIVTNLK